MSTLNTEIEKHIKKLVHPLKEAEELLEVLKLKTHKKRVKASQGMGRRYRHTRDTKTDGT